MDKELHTENDFFTGVLLSFDHDCSTKMKYENDVNPDVHGQSCQRGLKSIQAESRGFQVRTFINGSFRWDFSSF